ncbi:SGNH/GDSL hydrolase family protein [Roseococcus sp. YIM B11640]|uniref:SGNH/GDSL hydrolase family protein n=1 Tax=Roseococcus sp. YIM B11640 TaxID=3133973 RepID=UPI003C7E746D
MRRLAVLAILLLLAGPAFAARETGAAGCPDILVGDSLAVGMGPYARASGFQVVAKTGVGIRWLDAQTPRCARRVVVVLGTNDVRGMSPSAAEAYTARIEAAMNRWQAREVIWATPGCFPYDDSMERGSQALDRAARGRGHPYTIHSGRQARCDNLSGDGIHPTGSGYRMWWASLSESIGVAPSLGAEPYRATASRGPRHGGSRAVSARVTRPAPARGRPMATARASTRPGVTASRATASRATASRATASRAAASRTATARATASRPAATATRTTRQQATVRNASTARPAGTRNLAASRPATTTRAPAATTRAARPTAPRAIGAATPQTRLHRT